jgi:hypothetical protein
MAWGVVQCAVTIDESTTAATTKAMTFSAVTTMKTRSRGRRRCCMALLLRKLGGSATGVLITDESQEPGCDGNSMLLNAHLCHLLFVEVGGLLHRGRASGAVPGRALKRPRQHSMRGVAVR